MLRWRPSDHNHTKLLKHCFGLCSFRKMIWFSMFSAQKGGRKHPPREKAHRGGFWAFFFLLVCKVDRNFSTSGFLFFNQRIESQEVFVVRCLKPIATWSATWSCLWIWWFFACLDRWPLPTGILCAGEHVEPNAVPRRHRADVSPRAYTPYRHPTTFDAHSEALSFWRWRLSKAVRRQGVGKQNLQDCRQSYRAW